MAIVNTTVPLTAAGCDRIIQALAERYPAVSTEFLTATVYQRPIRALTLGSGPRKVLYAAAHHANEWITALVLLKFAEELAAAAEAGETIFGYDAQTLLTQATIHMVPMVDPDGVDLVTGALAPGDPQYEQAKAISANFPAISFPEGWKANLLGVDLNLQYPAGWLLAREIKFSQGYTRPAPRDYVGRAPLDQAETIALAAYTERVDPALVLAYHTQGGEIYWQFRGEAPEGARELGEEFARISGYTLAEVAEESAYAGYKDWFIKMFGRPGYTVEAGRGVSPLPLSQFDEIYRDNLGILVTAAKGS